MFEKENKDIQNKDILFYELINSFDEDNKEEAINDDIELDFKKIQSLCYLDDIFSNQILSRRNSSDMYNNLSLTSGSPLLGQQVIQGGRVKYQLIKNCIKMNLVII